MTATCEGPLWIGILGPVVACRDVPVPLTRDQRRLVAALAVYHPRPMPLDWALSATGHPNLDDPAARRALRTAMWRLRRQLGATAIETDGETYRLADTTNVDFAQFLRDTERGRVLLSEGNPRPARHVLGRAVCLWRDQFLADVPLAAPLPQPAAAAATIRGDAIEWWAAAAIQSGAADDPIDPLTRLVAAEPTRERAWASLIRAYLALDHQHDAHRVAAAAAATLEELGLLPGEELADAIARTSVERPERRRPSAVPPWLRIRDKADAYVGRNAELATLLDLATDLATQPPRLAIVSGAAGIGKTRLAAELTDVLARLGIPVWAGRTDRYDNTPHRAVNEVLAAAHATLVDHRSRRPPGEPLVTTPHSQEGPSTELDAAPVQHDIDLLDAATSSGAAVVILDDVDCADRDTLRFVRDVLDSQSQPPILIVLTLRDWDPPTPGTGRLFGELAAGSSTCWVALTGLDPAAVNDLPRVGELAADLDLDPAIVAAAIHAKTAGNPHLIHQVLRHPGVVQALANSDRVADVKLPVQLVRAVEGSLASLSAEHRDVLAAAAIQGVRFDATLLAASIDGDTGSALDAAERCQLVRPLANGRFEFHQELVVDVLVQTQSSTRRAERRRRIMQARQVTTSIVREAAS